MPEHNNNKTAFILYIYFIIDFFLHFPARIPAYGAIRPNLLLAIIISTYLFINKNTLPSLYKEPIFKYIIWIMIYVIITLPLVTWPGSVLKDNIQVFIKAIVFFFFTAYIIDSEKKLTTFLFVFCFCQVFRVLEPLYLHISDGYWGSHTYLGEGEFADRLSGSPADVINPNGLGFVVVTIIPFLYYLLWQSEKFLYKTFYLLLMPAMLYTLVLTMSRGAFLSLFVVIWMIYKNSNSKLFIIIIVLSASILVWPNLSDHQKDRYLSLFSSESRQSKSANGRLQGMADEFIVAIERPFIGHGLGTSAEAKARANIGWKISHNLYAEVLIELGLVGFIIFFKFLHSVYKKYKNNYLAMKTTVNLNEKHFSWRFNSTLGAVFWMYAFYSINYFGLSVYYWYMFAGLTLSYSRIYHSDKQIN